MVAEIEENLAEEEGYFRSVLSTFSTGLDLAMRFSARCDGVRVAQRHAWASWLFLRLCIVGQSLHRLATYKGDGQSEVYTLDHNSIAAVARNLIEATVMFFYVSEPNVDENEWALRKSILDIHDCVTRYRIFKSFQNQEQADQFRIMMSELRERAKNEKFMQTIDEKKREQLLSGQQLYINGLRSVVKQAGWDADRFDAVYAYLSAHSHSAPVSFYRTDVHGIDFSKPSRHQFALAGFSLEHADQSIRAACKRLIDVFPDLFPEVDRKKIDK